MQFLEIDFVTLNFKKESTVARFSFTHFLGLTIDNKLKTNLDLALHGMDLSCLHTLKQKQLLSILFLQKMRSILTAGISSIVRDDIQQNVPAVSSYVEICRLD